MEREEQTGQLIDHGEQGPYSGPEAVDVVDVDPHADDPGYHTRTKFLSIVAVAVGGVMTAAILVPVVGFAVADSVKEEKWRWVDVGPYSDFPEGETTSIAVDGPNPSANRRVYVRNRDDKLIAIWNRCAHLGCPVAYSKAADTFTCPCHGGSYDSEGHHVAGPPPRPLDRFDIKIVNAQGKDVEYASAKPTDRVLIGKAYSIDAEDRPYKLHLPGQPVTGVLSNLFPFV